MILGIVALIVVGPKDLPILLRTIGRYTGMLKKQAAEFRQQFDDAIREAELDQLKKDVTSFKDDVEGTIRDTGKSLTDEMDGARRSLEIDEFDDPDAHDANGIPIVREKKPAATTNAQAEVAAAPAAAPAEPSADEIPAEPSDNHFAAEAATTTPVVASTMPPPPTADAAAAPMKSGA